VKRIGLVTVVMGVVLPASLGAQAVPAVTGRYRFAITAAPSCPASMQVGPVSVLMDVTEATVAAGAEVSGRSASAFEIPDNGRFVFLRQGTRVHGSFAASTLELGLDTGGLYRIWIRIMADGTLATAGGGRARASGTAFGELYLSLASDPSGATVGYCSVSSPSYQWSLEPA
jgi:hypothetical protein